MPIPPAAERFIEHLCQAAARIPWQYFQLPVFGKEDPILRERVYCYELYHQLRMLLEEDGALAGYLLSGEIDKQGHAVIRQCAPDFVCHKPGRMENLAVVEVKPISADIAGVRKDRETLEYFLSPEVGYQAGIELVYGDGEKAPGVSGRVRRRGPRALPSTLASSARRARYRNSLTANDAYHPRPHLPNP